TPVAGPLTSDREAARALLHAVTEYADENRDLQVQIKVAPSEAPVLDGLVEGVAGTPWKPYYVVELPERIEDLRFGNSRNHARIRSTVNKAEKMNLLTREADSENDMRAWYELYLETMRWHATHPRSSRTLRAISAVSRHLSLFR